MQVATLHVFVLIPSAVRIKVPLVWTSVSLLAVSLPMYFLLPGREQGTLVAAAPDAELISRTEITVFVNDSLGCLRVGEEACYSLAADTLPEAHFAVDVFPDMPACLQMVWAADIYREQWDTLPQARFWRRVMTMTRDTCLVNIARDRIVVDEMPVWEWEALSDSAQQAYKDSIRSMYALDDDEVIYVTAGKKHYYKFDRVLPSITRGIEIFRRENVDPWYAQAVLLIESPGQLVYSPVGAYGSFQLMKDVAYEQGLVVNDSIDEREDFDKAARAAARFIATRCLPQTRSMLRRRGISYDESALWFRLLVLHSYHAGAGNVAGVLNVINPTEGGMALLKQVWRTEFGGFKNASQNYSQVALASTLELDRLMRSLPDSICRDTSYQAIAAVNVSDTSAVATSAP
ncbi:MAG: hypothetical protein OHK0039_07840 [Bacteroidia bacterium]